MYEKSVRNNKPNQRVKGNPSFKIKSSYKFICLPPFLRFPIIKLTT